MNLILEKDYVFSTIRRDGFLLMDYKKTRIKDSLASCGDETFVSNATC